MLLLYHNIKQVGNKQEMSQEFNKLSSTTTSEQVKDAAKKDREPKYSKFEIGLAAGGIALAALGGIASFGAHSVSAEQESTAREIATDVYEMPEVHDTLIGDALEDTLADSGEGYLADNLTTTSILGQEYGATVLPSETISIDVTQQLNEARDLAASSENLAGMARTGSTAMAAGGFIAGLGIAGAVSDARKRKKQGS